MFKKKIRNAIITFVIVMFSVFAMFTLNSCKKGEKEEKDILTEFERTFFDTFTTDMLTNFYDPSSVKFINIQCSYMNGSLVQFTALAKNKLGGNVQEEFFLVAKAVPNATEYYEQAGYDDFQIDDLFAQEFIKGDYRNSDSLDSMTTLAINKDKTGMIFFFLRNYPSLYNKLEDDLTYNIGNLNLVLSNYKASQGW